MTKQMPATEAIPLIDAAWTAWRAALASTPEERWTEPGVCGEWSIKDLLGHIAVWDARARRDIERIGRGEQREPLNRVIVDSINSDGAALRANRNIDEQRTEMESTHADMLKTLGSASVFDVEALAGDTWDHYPEHTEQIIAWRKPS